MRVHALASQILRMATQRVADDWESRYSVRPVAAYTYVGAEHSGYCYRRAGWTVVGRTSERRGGAGTVRATALEDGWREALRHVERRPVGALAGAFDGADADWAQREYGRTCHTDGRVRDRILRMGRAWLKSMGGDLPVIFPEKAEQKATYRLLSNPRISMQHILEPHCEATADRCRGEAVVLAMQDTTALNYTGPGGHGGPCRPRRRQGQQGHPGPCRVGGDAGGPAPGPVHDGRGLPGGSRGGQPPLAPGARAGTGARGGLPGHAGDLRLRPRGRLLGHARPRQGRGDPAAGARQPFGEAAGADARRREGVPVGSMSPPRSPVAVTELTIPAAGGPRARKERVARLEIRTTEVELLPPHWDRGAEPLPMLAVSATETGTADGDDPLHWLLLTTERPADGEVAAVHAATVLDWYRRRWTIETWFRTLKTGTRIKDRRLDHADDLRKCIAFDAITACHVADLTILAQERPETPATEVFPEEDIDLLQTMLEAQGHRDARRMPAGQAPDIQTVVHRPRAPRRGPSHNHGSRCRAQKKVWQGLERLNWAVQVRDALGERKLE